VSVTNYFHQLAPSQKGQFIQRFLNNNSCGNSYSNSHKKFGSNFNNSNFNNNFSVNTSRPFSSSAAAATMTADAGGAAAVAGGPVAGKVDNIEKSKMDHRDYRKKI
jgi:hypothetical protein